MSQKKFDREKWKAEKAEKEAAMAGRIKDMARSFRESPEKIADFLSFSERFYRYSVKNVMLIQDQNPGALLCKPFSEWKKEGVSVLRGEKGMKIYAPAPVTLVKVVGKTKALSILSDEEQLAYDKGMLPSRRKMSYKIGTVFDISQTDFPKEKYPEIIGVGSASITHHEMYEKLKMFSENELSCPVSEKLHGVAMGGCYIPAFNCIEINSILEDTRKASTLSHEIGHALMHSDKPDYSTERKEFEADCVSIMIDSHLGLDITDSRKSHLAYNFKKLELQLDGEEVNIDDILSDVFDVFGRHVEKIDKYISMEVPEKKVEIDKKHAKERDLPPDRRNMKRQKSAQVGIEI